jgi:predicted transcriptional regulator
MIERLRPICAEYGVSVRFEDLGSWGATAELRSEYDPERREIVVNRRTAPHLVSHAIAHELYHHKEAIGEIVRMHQRRDRERAADEHAMRLIAQLR